VLLFVLAHTLLHGFVLLLPYRRRQNIVAVLLLESY
jgi:hypothetical protein